MDEETIQVKTKFDDYLKEMPSEVQDFMWSDLYDIIIVAIQQSLSLTNAQTTLIKNAGYDLLMEVKTMEETAEELKNAGMDDGLIAKSLYLLDTEVLTRAENITEYFTEEPEESDSAVAEEPEKSIPASDVFARLNQTLVKPTTLAPTKREYSAGLSATTPVVKEAPAIDPYRELPDIK